MRVGQRLRFAQGRCGGGDTQHAAAAGDGHIFGVDLCAGVEGHARVAVLCDSQYVADARRVRVFFGGQHHAERDVVAPIQLHFVECALRRRQQHIKQVGIQAAHDGLCFWIAHTAIEFQYFDRAVG